MDRRIPLLSLAADVVAIVVFAAVGRSNHGEAFDVVGLLGTAAPFLLGALAAWCTPWVRADPTGIRSGATVLLGTLVIGFAVRALMLDRLPLSFVLVATVVLAVLLVGWRGLSALVARRAAHRVP